MLSLVERLGHGPQDRLLIVNCDDIGSSHAANLACLEAMSEGVATSATLMVPCPWALEAVEMFAGLDVGVHLTLTAEYPGYRWRSLTGAGSLHDAQGYLPTKTSHVMRYADPDDVRRECRAQIEQALAWGVDVTHIDSHMGGNQIDPRFFEIYMEMAVEFALPLRMVGPDIETLLSFPCRAPAQARGIVFPDEFVSEWGRPTHELLAQALPALAPGVAEVNLHPVYEGAELHGYDTTQAWIRIGDQACAMAQSTAELIAGQQLRPISFRPLRDLQRGLI
ncbi:MAG: ChbG/HpnK family deacetylase [Pseudomonadota bacterium]|uniref:ChbG/HpnK family deacetylase n=1 Tax=unclassified Phenylobacterium TaxID=2640670 RepID=UPI00070099CA|nr:MULTISPECIES: ChbG/HpnK family deacetylase [unclassified Phenylobacterium]KRB49613.1 hypothetical protein ASE02_17555 [Phenylobacterium sp. Root700]MBT9469938.1 ChbG/HpnK family deacetylase [Phenylobacterium sp.]